MLHAVGLGSTRKYFRVSYDHHGYCNQNIHACMHFSRRCPFDCSINLRDSIQSLYVDGLVSRCTSSVGLKVLQLSYLILHLQVQWAQELTLTIIERFVMGDAKDLRTCKQLQSLGPPIVLWASILFHSTVSSISNLQNFSKLSSNLSLQAQKQVKIIKYNR